MYCPTSFCERENSSKRWRISSVRVTAGLTVRATAECFVPPPDVPSFARSKAQLHPPTAVTIPVRATLLLAAVLAVPATATASTLPYPTSCAVELSRPLAATGTGPICGTDEGDDVFFTGESAPTQFFGE